MKATKNDYKLIKYLFECKFLTRKQIKKYVLKDTNNSYINKRLPSLKENKYIKYMRNPFQFINEQYIYLADFFSEHSLEMKEIHNDFKNMCDEFNLNYIDPDKYDIIEQLNYGTIIHDYYSNNVRFMFEKAGAKGWIPDYIIRKRNNNNKVPDGIIKGQKNIAVELERNLKYPKRYVKAFNLYQKMSDIDLVIYVTSGKSSDNIYKKLNEFASPSFLESKHYNNVDIKLDDDFYKNYYFIKYEDLKNENYIIYNSSTNRQFNLKNLFRK